MQKIGRRKPGGPTLDGHDYELNRTPLLTERWISDGKGQLQGPKFLKVNPVLKQNDPRYVRDHS
jgi:hypothetical protein